LESNDRNGKMLKSIEQSPLYRICNPGSIAFFGASNSHAPMGSIIFSSLRAFGFQGALYPVHPTEAQVQGIRAYRSVLDLPQSADLAVLVLPTGIVEEILDQCGRKGIKHAVVVSGGFKEVGDRGAGLEKRIKETALKHGIRFLGPNCIGVANPYERLNTTPFPYEGPPGFIGMASQSGSFVTQMFQNLSKRGLGFSTAMSVGNEANVDIVDCMEYLGACPNTKVIALYIEGITRGKRFVETARAIVPHKPIVAFYVGGTETGKRAGLSHTGAMAGPDRLYDGMFQQSGVLRARSLQELFDFCWVLGALPTPGGNRVLIQTHSGGPGTAAADACGRAGLDLPPLSAETVEKLAPFLPHTASANNPVDFTFVKNPTQYILDIPKLLLEEKNADVLLLYLLVPSKLVTRALVQLGVPTERAPEKTGKVIERQTEAIAALLHTQKKPIVGYTLMSLEEPFSRSLIGRGLPLFDEAERAARAIMAMVQYSRFRDKLLAGMGDVRT